MKTSVYIEIIYRNRNYLAYIDTGSGVTMAKREFHDNWIEIDNPIRGIDITGKISSYNIGCKDVWIYLGKYEVKIPRIIMNNMIGVMILLGNDFISLFKTYIQTRFYCIFITPCGKRIYCSRKFLSSDVELRSIGNLYSTYKNDEIQDWIEDFKHQIKDIYGENPLNLWEKDKIYADIKLKDPMTIIRNRPIRYSKEDVKEFEEQIKELLNLGLIQESKSSHSSAAFMVRKHSEIKRGKARMVVDYRLLNKETIFDGYFIPHKDTLINFTIGNNYFSKFDCKSGFWQIKLGKESIPLTAFSVPNGHYEWKVLPFGLKNAPQIFQKRMDKVFNKIKEFCLVYIDDMLIVSKTEKEHKEHLKDFYKICINHGILLSQKKSEIFKDEIEFLGFIINNKGIKMQPHISEKIKDFPDELKDKKEVQKFNGCLTYASEYIKGLAEIRQPLMKLLKKNAPFIWTKEHTFCVKRLKGLAIDLPTMTFPQEIDLLILETDASNLFWGAVLKCKSPGDKEEKICRYTSGTFKKAEINYHSNEKELLAAKYGIKKFNYFLLPKNFILRTDNRQIKGLIFNKLPETPEYNRLRRWQTSFAYYDFKIEYIKGTDNFLADFLSREGYKHEDCR